MTYADYKSHKITEGTKEWADSNVNIYNGCSNNCRYCYAKKMAIRFKRKTHETWKIMEPNMKKIEKGYAKRKGRVMFPSSHDITEEALDHCVIVLEKLLESENEVLITTKPRLACIKTICAQFKDYKDLLQFRFTITSMDNKKLSFWEPGASDFQERLESLKYAYKHDFMTSVSIEPFLDKDPFPLVEKLLPYCTESIWIGKMNYIKATRIEAENRAEYKFVRDIVSKKNLKKIMSKFEECNPEFVRIKDSNLNYLGFQLEEN